MFQCFIWKKQQKKYRKNSGLGLGLLIEKYEEEKYYRKNSGLKYLYNKDLKQA
jgi:hypothetical protein